MRDGTVEKVVYASRISDYLFCPYSYILNRAVKESGLPMTGDIAKTCWLQNAFKKIFPENPEVGTDIVHIENVPPEELSRYLRYKSPETFAKAAAFLGWKGHVIDERGRVHDRDVVWLYAGQWMKAMGEIHRACKNYYRFLVQDGIPILSTIGREVAFNFRGRKYVIVLDSVKKGCIIAEYGTKKKDQQQLDGDWKVTLKALAFTSLARDVEAYRMKWGIDARTIRRWGDAAIAPDVRFVYYSLLDGEDGAMLETRRNDDHIKPMLEVIGSVERSIAERNFEPNHRSCDTCRYNVPRLDGAPVCDKRAPKAKLQLPMDMFPAAEEKHKPQEEGDGTGVSGNASGGSD